MSNGSLFQKTGIGIKKFTITSKKVGEKNLPKPLTPQELRKKIGSQKL